jgi:hypothetical protein
MTSSPRTQGGGVYLAVTVVALLATVYLAFQVIGFIFKLAFLALAVWIGLRAWRAWNGEGAARPARDRRR